MEPGPSRSMNKRTKSAAQDTKEENSIVPPEVAEMMKNAIWPEEKMNDLLYNSLFQKPIMIIPTKEMNELKMKGEFIYRDVEKVVKKIRRQKKHSNENNQPAGEVNVEDGENTDSE